MKKFFLTSAVAILFFACSSNSEKAQTAENQVHEATAAHQHVEKKPEGEQKKKPLSPHTSAMAMIGDNHVHIDYSSPGKRGRMIFGGLVGFGQLWSTGAHNATNITFDKAVTVGGAKIPAGKYGLFTIPGEEEWIIILNKDWDMHLSDDYKETNDIVRLQAVPQKLEEVVESLTFEVKDRDQGNVTLKWDQTAVSFEVKNTK